MVLAERNSELVRNGRRSRGPSPNGHGVGGGASGVGVGNSNSGVGAGGGMHASNAGGGAGTPETSSDDDNSIKRNGKSKTKQSEYEEKIRVGRDYQAVCPSLIPEPERKPEVLNDRALLVWSPTKDIPDVNLESYISVAKEKYGYNGEQALGMLFWHKHDLERAVMDLANFTPFPDEWTVEDKVLFDQAFQFHGKSFHRIRQMLPDKSIASLVKYYYSWKKTRHRQSVMDRQEKAKASKEGSENGSENGSNEDSDNDDKDQTLASTSGLQDQTNSASKVVASGGVGIESKSSENITTAAAAAAAADASSCVEAVGTASSAVVDSETGAASTNTAATAAVAVTSVANKQQQQQQQRQQTPPNSNTDSSCTGGRTTPTNGTIAGGGGGCTNCGVACNLLNASPHGKMCSSCHHHWRRTGNKRPTSGPYFGKRSRDRNAERHKRKPPRGMYINHDDILALANANCNHDELLANTDREIVSLLSQVQLNKQNISATKRKNSESLEDLRPSDNANRINSRWSNDELLLAVQGVRKYGKDFTTIAETIGTKTEAHVRTFYVNYRRRYNLDQVLKKHEAEKEATAAAAAAATTTTTTTINNITAVGTTTTTTTAATGTTATTAAVGGGTETANKKDEQPKKQSKESSSANANTTAAAVVAAADESDNTTSSETTASKFTNDEIKSSSSSSINTPKDVVMEIDLESDPIDMPPAAKKLALSVGNQEFPKASV